jgi:CRP-like cAMP-binding protein
MFTQWAASAPDALGHGFCREALLQFPEIRRFSRVVQYGKRDLIIREGMTGDAVCMLLSGTAMSYRTAENGQQVMLRFLQPNQFFGYMTLFRASAHTMTVETLEKCENLEIGKAAFRKLLLQEPALLWSLTEEMADGIRISTQIVENSFLGAERRIHKCLLRLCEQFGVNVETGIELRINITQDTLAKCAGTTRVTTARILGKLMDEGVLRVKPKPWVVCRIEGLILPSNKKSLRARADRE